MAFNDLHQMGDDDAADEHITPSEARKRAEALCVTERADTDAIEWQNSNAIDDDGGRQKGGSRHNGQQRALSPAVRAMAF